MGPTASFADCTLLQIRAQKCKKEVKLLNLMTQHFDAGLPLCRLLSQGNNTDSKAGYEPLVVLLRESMQRATFAEELEMSMEHIVTKLNWASTQLSKAVECSLASRRQD